MQTGKAARGRGAVTRVPGTVAFSPAATDWSGRPDWWPGALGEQVALTRAASSRRRGKPPPVRSSPRRPNWRSSTGSAGPRCGKRCRCWPPSGVVERAARQRDGGPARKRLGCPVPAIVMKALEAVGRGEQLRRDLFDVRRILECAAAEMAAKTATDAQRNAIAAKAAVLVAEAADPETPLSQFLETDRDFHDLLAQIGGNLALRQIIRQVHVYVSASWTSVLLGPSERPGGSPAAQEDLRLDRLRRRRPGARRDGCAHRLRRTGDRPSTTRNDHAASAREQPARLRAQVRGIDSVSASRAWVMRSCAI